jgi:predicted phage terminase large subunit-like protein
MTEPDVFAIKYLNDPRQINKIKFPRELLIRRTINHGLCPHQGMIVTTVDTAYSTQSWADYTVIMTAIVHGGRFYIINMVRGRFNEYELPAVIAAAAYKWKPKRIAIEDSVGVKWMGRELRREMDKLQISVPVEFVSLGHGSKSKSKQLKAKPVVRLLGDERMFFLNSCEGIQDLYSELEKFTGTSDDTHDDIVSALSLLVEQFGAYAEMDSKINFAESQFIADQKSQLIHDRIYGLGRYALHNASNHAEDNPVTLYEQEAAAALVPAPAYEFDPLSELMT